MMCARSLLRLCIVVGIWSAPAAGIGLEIHNKTGAVIVHVSPTARFLVQGKGHTRQASGEDIRITRGGPRTIVRCDPADGETIDLEVQVPIGFPLDITTDGGAIEINGFVRYADLHTKTGAILLGVPWPATRIQLDADTEPPKFTTPDGVRFSRNHLTVTEDRTIWRLRDRLPENHVTYGEIRVKAEAPREVRLTDLPIPEDSPVKMHWQAPDVLEQLLEAPARRPPPPKTEAAAPTDDGVDDPDGAVFRSDVRMVNMVVAITTEKGEPATDLGKGDFEIIENGQPQQVTFAGSDNVPFNLAILLDLSGSTQPDRVAMISAAKRFVSLAGPQDRVAVYALADDSFHVISNLTSDSKKLLDTIERLPDVAGASPLYDAIVLAYAEDLSKRPGERNALVVISDGIDNQVSRQNRPSKVKFKRLLKAAEEMHALVYPVFLLSGERFGRNWSKKARRNMEELVDASGGRLFPAESIQDLEPVFPLVEAELRSVYSVAYYPEDQNFGGGWRSVQVKVKRPGMKVRARPGYYAK